MASEHVEYWVARPTHSTGFGFASFSAVRTACETACANAVGATFEIDGLRVLAALPVDRRYEVSVTIDDDGTLVATMTLDGSVHVQARGGVPATPRPD